MSKSPSPLPARDTIMLFFTLDFLGTLWFAVISDLLESPARSMSQWLFIGVLAVLTIMMLIFLGHTSKRGLLETLKPLNPGRKARRGD